MYNIISIKEVRLKRSLKEATAALIKARNFVADGKEVPNDLIPRLENIIDDLERQLTAVVEDN